MEKTRIKMKRNGKEMIRNDREEIRSERNRLDPLV